MATPESVRKAQKVKEEAERRNPLLKLGLGELIRESQRIFTQDPNVLMPENEISREGKERHTQYIAIIKEINRRELEYQSYKSAPKYE